MLLFLLLIINIKFKFVHETNKEKSTEILTPLLLTSSAMSISPKKVNKRSTMKVKISTQQQNCNIS